MVSMTHLVTYSDSNMSLAAKICVASAGQQGIDKAWAWTDAAIKQTTFYEENKTILDHPRAGYWLWKPYIILDALRRIKDGDILVYADAGVEFIAPIKHIIDRMQQDVWLFGNQYRHFHWCKADVMVAMDSWPDGNQVQASLIVVRNTAYVRAFVEEWLRWCQIPGLIDDGPSLQKNHTEFQEHRHDQAILTCLAFKENIPFHWWAAMYNCGAFQYEKGGYADTYPILFHHHRCRNADIQQPGIFRDYFHKKYPGIITN